MLGIWEEREGGDRPILTRRGFCKGRVPRARSLDHLNHPYHRNSQALGPRGAGPSEVGSLGFGELLYPRRFVGLGANRRRLAFIDGLLRQDPTPSGGQDRLRGI